MSSTRSVSSHSNSRVDASNVSVNSQPSEDRGLSRRKERTPTQNRMALPTISFMQIPPSPSHRRSIHNVGEMPSMYRLSRGSTPRRSVTPRDDSAREGEAMRVYVRVRPFSEREVAHPTTEVRSVVRIDAENQSLLSLLDPTRGYTSQSTYTFTHCFWSVFERVADGTDELTPTASMGRMSARRHSRSPGQSMTLESRVFEPELDSGLISPRYKGAGSSVVMADVAGSTNPPPLATQAEVYAKVGKPILINVLEGYNGCIFAYGPTSSGKTYTMLGYSPGTSAYRASKARSGSMPIPLKATELMSCVIDESTSMLMSDDNRLTSPSSSVPPNETSGEAQTGADEDDDCDLEGIIPRMCMDLFSSLHVKQRSDSSLSYKVEVSYYEIYNEKVFDLLAPTKGELRVRQNPTTGPYVEKVTMRTVQQQEDVAKILRKGRRELHMASTKFNDHSSRSHSILSVDVVQIYADGEDTNKTKSKLSLVDLAGSERTGAAGAEGKQFADGININLSLTVLGRVIDSLAELSQNRTSTGQVVPYRDSKLTWLLSDSLGGNSLTSMIATVSPHALSYEETKQTLRYASRARQIMNCAVRNEDPQLAYIRSLRCEVTRLQELLKNSASVQYTQSYVMGLEKRCRKLEQTCEEDQQTIAQLRADLEAASLRFASASDAGSAVPLFLPGPLHAWFDMLLDCVDAKMSLWMEGISGGSPSAKPPDRSLPIIDLHKARATPSIGTTLTSAEVTPRSEQRGAGAGFPDQLSAMTDIVTRLRSTYDESVARMATELETAKTHYHHNLTDAKAAFEAELLAVRSELSGERRRRMALERAMTAEELKAVDAAEPPSGALSSRSERSDNDTAHPCPSGSSSGPGRDSGPARTGDPPLAVPPTTTCSVSDWRPPTASTGDFAASEVEHVLFDPSEADEDAFLALLAGPHGDVNPSSFLRQLYPDPEGDEDGEHQQESGCDDHLCVSSALEELCTAQDSHHQSIDALHRKVTLRLAELVCSA